MKSFICSLAVTPLFLLSFNTSALELANTNSNLVTVAAQEQGDFSGGLISALTSSLGVTEDQANGGMGAILEVAKTALSNDEFKSLASSIPGVGDMLSAVPDVPDSNSDKASNMLGGFGGDSVKALTDSLQITEQFEALGLSPDMIGQFADMGMKYLQSEEGQQAADLLKKGVSSLL